MNRVTIMFDDSAYKKLRDYQAKKIKETNSSYSFSKCVNDIVVENL